MDFCSCCSQILQKERKNGRLHERNKIDDVSVNLIYPCWQDIVNSCFLISNLTNKCTNTQRITSTSKCCSNVWSFIGWTSTCHCYGILCWRYQIKFVLILFSIWNCWLIDWLIRKFGQVVVWFKCEIEWRTQNSIDSRNCSRNASSSQSQHYYSSWSCCKKHFTHWKWTTQNLCTFSFVSFSFHLIDFSFCFCVIFLFIDYVKQIEIDNRHKFIFLNWMLFLGFWNGTNSWESRRRKS
jgi:hypothetical protein